MTSRTRTRSTVMLGTTALLAAGMLSACSFGGGAARPGGTPKAAHSHSDAEDAISGLPGITSAEIATSTEGTPNQVLLLARVSAEYAADPAALLDYVLQEAWSTTDQKPTTTVRVELVIDGQDLDLEALAEQIGLAGSVNAKNKYDASVRIQVDEMATAYGPWPGAVPSPPKFLTNPTE